MFKKEDKKIRDILKADTYIPKATNDNIDNILNDIKLHRVEQKTKQHSPILKVQFKLNKWVIYLSSFLTIFVCSNVYARTAGYENIFFMIQEKTIQSSLENMFSDEQIVLSYKTFNISKNVKMQINTIDLYEKNCVLHCKLSSDNILDESFDFIVYDEKTNLKLGNKKVLSSNKNNSNSDLDFEIYLDKINKDNNLVIEIKDKYNIKIKTVKIDLQNKIIEAITNNEEMEKISQIKLFEKLKQKLEERDNIDVEILKITDIYYEYGRYSIKFIYLDKNELENINETFDNFGYASADFFMTDGNISIIDLKDIEE